MHIPLDPSDLALLVLATVLSIIGWLLIRLYAMWSGRVMEHENALKAMPERYATKAELAQLGESIEKRLDDIKDAIKEGNGATRMLLAALIKTEKEHGQGIRPD